MSSFDAPSPFASVGAVPRVVVEALLHRGELAALELKEVRVHGTVTALLSAAACFLVLLGGIAGTFAVAAAVWNRPDRGMILSGVALGYLLVAAALAFLVAHRLKSWQPFTESRLQFKEDCSCVHEILNSKLQ